MKTEIEIVKEFEQMSHCLLKVEFAQKVAGIFGMDCTELIDIYETSSEPKGYHGPTGEGVAAFQLSTWICDKLGLEYTSYFGRGTQHRECCKILIDYRF